MWMLPEPENPEYRKDPEVDDYDTADAAFVKQNGPHDYTVSVIEEGTPLDEDEAEDYRVEAVFLNGVRIWMDTDNPLSELGAETAISFTDVGLRIGEHPTAAGTYAWVYV